MKTITSPAALQWSEPKNGEVKLQGVLIRAKELKWLVKLHVCRYAPMLAASSFFLNNSLFLARKPCAAQAQFFLANIHLPLSHTLL